MLQKLFQDSPFPDVHIEGARLALRPPHRADGETWIRLREDSRDFLAPWSPEWPREGLNASMFQRRLRMQADEWRAGRGRYFLIFNKDSGEMVGGINLTRITYGVALTGVVGYWLTEKHVRKGYMTEALALVLDYAFDRMNLHRIEAGTLPHNAASRGVLDKLGFVEEGLARKYLKIAGIWQDHVIYATLCDDWLQRRSDFNALRLPS